MEDTEALHLVVHIFLLLCIICVKLIVVCWVFLVLLHLQVVVEILSVLRTIMWGFFMVSLSYFS